LRSIDRGRRERAGFRPASAASRTRLPAPSGSPDRDRGVPAPRALRDAAVSQRPCGARRPERFPLPSALPARDGVDAKVLRRGASSRASPPRARSQRDGDRCAPRRRVQLERQVLRGVRSDARNDADAISRRWRWTGDTSGRRVLLGRSSSQKQPLLPATTRRWSELQDDSRERTHGGDRRSRRSS
jgi:hypothetical protein